MVSPAASTNELDVIAELYEQIAALPMELRILEFVWLHAASHARTAQLGKTDRFALECERQLASLDRMAATVRADQSGL